MCSAVDSVSVCSATKLRMRDVSVTVVLLAFAGDYVHVDGIYVLSGFPEDASGRGVTVGRLMQAHFGDSFWPSTSAAILRLQPGPGDRLSWNDWTVRVPVKVLGRDSLSHFVCQLSGDRVCVCVDVIWFVCVNRELRVARIWLCYLLLCRPSTL